MSELEQTIWFAASYIGTVVLCTAGIMFAAFTNAQWIGAALFVAGCGCLYSMKRAIEYGA